jgi:hypothetical protein
VTVTRLSDDAIQQIMTAAPSPQSVIAEVADRLVHLHAAIDTVLPRVGQPAAAEGVRREMRTIADEMLDLSARLHGAVADLCGEGS